MGEIVIVGSGIIGLWTALLLSREGHAKDTTVVAKHLPGDLSSEFTSPIAGAHFSCAIAGASDKALRFNRISYALLKEVFKLFEGKFVDAGLDRLLQTELFAEQPPQRLIDDIKQYADEFEIIGDQQWLQSKGASYGIRYRTFNFYPSKLLVFLKNYLEAQGVVFVRATLGHISEARAAAGRPNAGVVFNCGGVMATSLGGVRDDKATFPVRGQVVSVKAPWIKENIGLEVPGQPPTYIIPRVHSGGRVILGGYSLKNDWTEGTRTEQTKSILERTTKLLPELLRNGPLEVIDERAAFRPGREDGARIAKDVIDGVPVIHNYGAAGTGYQAGLAMSLDAVNLYLGPQGRKSKL